MKALKNFNFDSIKTVDDAFSKLESEIRDLADLVEDPFGEDDRDQLSENIEWIKRFYETAETRILESDRS
ncbi:MAG: hypothetical protein EBT27_10230 [Betaproteobacteria bacterium]|nr:hypothetical protein [Betaproteobacteria bacterium]